MADAKESKDAAQAVDYTLANPDTLTKYKAAGQISQAVLAQVTEWCTPGAKIIDICERGDNLLDEEIGKVFKGKKIHKGIAHPCTISPGGVVTPVTPVKSDEKEAAAELQQGDIVKIQLGAQIDGLGTIVCDSIVVGVKPEPASLTGRDANLFLAAHYANELLLRLLVPGVALEGVEGGDSRPALTQARIIQLMERAAKEFDCSIIENTTSWLFERNDIEGKRKIILSPGEGLRGDGLPEVGDVWGVEIGVSPSSSGGRTKRLTGRTTLMRRTAATYGLKRPSSRAILSEIVKKFGTFPFSLRQLDDERAAKVGVVECIRTGVVRAYEPEGDRDGEPVVRLLTTIAVTKNGIVRLATPPAWDLTRFKSEHELKDEELVKLMEQPLTNPKAKIGKKKNKKKRKPKKKNAAGAAAGSGDSDSEESDDE